MVWTFFALALGALGLTVKIVLDHVREAQGLSVQIQRLRSEETRLEQEIETHRQGLAEAKSECDRLNAEVSERQLKVESIQAQIDQRKGDMARRGKYRV